MKSKCGHWASVHWSGTNLLHLGGSAKAVGGSSPAAWSLGFQQNKRLWYLPNWEGLRALSPCSFYAGLERPQSGVNREAAWINAYSSIQKLISLIEAIEGVCVCVCVEILQSQSLLISVFLSSGGHPQLLFMIASTTSFTYTLMPPGDGCWPQGQTRLLR